MNTFPSAHPADSGISCLVISRSPQLLNRMLESLRDSRAFWHPEDEVLCSWNGSAESEADLKPLKQPFPEFRIAQREPYHFASNMNSLARHARGEWLLLLNDDLILDPGSVDRALHLLSQHPEAGVIGGRLRCSDGRLGHAGLLFSNQGTPYNRLRPQLGTVVDPNGMEALESGPISAVTGALMLLRRSDFLEVGGLRESFRVCGEDIALCLDLALQMNKTAYYASDVTAIHDEKSTRGAAPDRHDILAVGDLALSMMKQDISFRAAQAHWALQEAEMLYGICERYRQKLIDDLAASNARERDWEARENDWIARNNQWREERQLLEATIADLGLQLQALKSSSSWLVTRPWRSIGRLFASLFRK